jgi:hypothetical protein
VPWNVSQELKTKCWAVALPILRSLLTLSAVKKVRAVIAATPIADTNKRLLILPRRGRVIAWGWREMARAISLLLFGGTQQQHFSTTQKVCHFPEPPQRAAYRRKTSRKETFGNNYKLACFSLQQCQKERTDLLQSYEDRSSLQWVNIWGRKTF